MPLRHTLYSAIISIYVAFKFSSFYCLMIRINVLNFVVFPANCNFEKGFCNWKSEAKADDAAFQWSRGSGNTPSSSTGPPFDHTKQDISGIEIATSQAISFIDFLDCGRHLGCEGDHRRLI